MNRAPSEANRAVHLIMRILNICQIDAVSISTPQKGYRNTSYPVTTIDGKMINVIIYKNEPGILDRIRNAHDVAFILKQSGMPVRSVALERPIIKLSSRSVIRYAGVYDYLSGTTIPWDGYTMNHIKLLGWTMSDMHAVLDDSNDQYPLLPAVVDEYKQIMTRMKRYFSRTDVRCAMHDKISLVVEDTAFDWYSRVLEICSELPDQQPLHMDFVRGNILFSDNTEHARYTLSGVSLAGIIDFEKVAFGSRMFDIARTLAFLLVDCKYKEPHKIKKYFLDSGYSKRGGLPYHPQPIALDGKGHDLLEQLITIFLLYDFYKFLRHNPYEYLDQNEHFVRTRDMLVERAILSHA